MTPQPRLYTSRDLLDLEKPAPAPTIKLEVVKYLGGMLLAGLVSYYATLYGLREEVAVLKVRIEYLTKQTDAQTKAIEALTDSITAHTLAHAAAVKSRRP
jgi:hypothetical protein